MPATQRERAENSMMGPGYSKGCCIPCSRHMVRLGSDGEQTPMVQPQRLHYLTRAFEGTASAESSASRSRDATFKPDERGQHRMVGDSRREHQQNPHLFRLQAHKGGVCHTCMHQQGSYVAVRQCHMQDAQPSPAQPSPDILLNAAPPSCHMCGAAPAITLHTYASNPCEQL